MTSGGIVALAGALPAQQRQPVDSVRADSLQRFVLDPLEITVTRRPAELSDIPLAVSAISAPLELRGRLTHGLDEALATVPGVFVANRYNESLDQRVSIRGFGSRSAFGVRGVKILLDGVPQTLPDGQGQLTNIELTSVGTIEVLRGSASSLYGNASGGVIDLRTAPPDPTRIAPTARVLHGAYGLTKWRIGTSAPVARGTVALTGAHTTMDGYRQHSEANIRQVGLRVEQDVSARTTVLLNAQFADNPVLDNPGSLTAQEVEADPSQANARNVDADAGKSLTQGQLGLTVTHRLAGGGRVELTGFGLGRDIDNPLSFAFIGLSRTAYGARGTATFPVHLSESVLPRLTFGFDLQRQRDDRLNLNPGRTEVTLDQLERVTEIGPFAQVALDAGRYVTVTLGTRFDRVSFDAEDGLLTDGDDSGDRIMSAWSGSGGIVVHAADAMQPYLSIGTSFETPTTTELVNQPSGAGGFNPDVEPQKATTFEVGLRGRVGGVASYSLAAFNADVRDELISFEVPTQPGREFFRNAGSATHRGIELRAAVRPVRSLTLVTAYTFADYTFDAFETTGGNFDGNEIPGVPSHNLHGSVRIDTPFGAWIASDHTYSSSYFVDDANTVENASYFVTNIRGGWEGSVSRLTVSPFFGVLNLFDERYVSSVVVNATFGRYFEPAPPLNAYVGVEIR